MKILQALASPMSSWSGGLVSLYVVIPPIFYVGILVKVVVSGL